ncbi:hypothetical protein [Streptosporangium sp. NPDC000396]|uniref:hypothetical protein n=1 Tax=Streptosporangium sp. NPDC000396 TaxID=3366185 RepID=UPI0036C9BAFE
MITSNITMLSAINVTREEIRRQRRPDFPALPSAIAARKDAGHAGSIAPRSPGTELSTGRLRPLFASLRQDDQDLAIQRLLARENTSARAAVLTVLESFDADAYLRKAGLSGDDLAIVRARLLIPAAGVAGDPVPGPQV